MDEANGEKPEQIPRRRLNWARSAPYMLTALILATETVWATFHWRAGHQWRGLAVAYCGAISVVFVVAAVAELLKGKGADMSEEQLATLRWQERNRRARDAGCKCGRPATHVRRAFGTLGAIPAEIWTCEDHVNVNQWEKGPGDDHYRPVPEQTFDGMEQWVSPAQRAGGTE